jgi:hypothetical protein
VVVDAVMIDGWMLGMIEVKGWFGGERENKVDMFWNRVFVGGVLVGWESKKVKCQLLRGAGKERPTSRPRTCHIYKIPATRLVSFAVQSTQSSPWRSPHTSPRCVARHCDDTCIECCATCMRAVRAKPVPISIQDTPAAIPHSSLEQRMWRLVYHSIRHET